MTGLEIKGRLDRIGKTALEHFQDIKELEVADGTVATVKDINDMNILLEAPMIKVVDLLPYKCKQVEKSLKALDIIKRFIWVEDDKLMCGRYGDVEIELDESDFEDDEEFDLLKGNLNDEQ